MDKVVYTVKEIAELTGFTEDHLRKEIRAGKLKAAGDRIKRISAVELNRWWNAKGGGDLFPLETQE